MLLKSNYPVESCITTGITTSLGDEVTVGTVCKQNYLKYYINKSGNV